MKFILRLGGPCCPYPLYNIQLSEGSESMIELSTNGLYKGNAVVITPKSGYRMNKLSITVNGQLIEVSENLASFIMPKKDVTITVTDLRTDLEKVQDLLTNSGYTTNQGLFTDETYIWMEGTNSSSLKKAIIFADNTNCINVVTAGASGEEVVSQLSSVTKTKDLGQRVTLLRNINSYDYYMPDYITSFIGESITIVDIYNGQNYVDLGLPSGTKWATTNVGATSETGYGVYLKFAGGLSTSGIESIALTLKDDATFYYGKIWHTPTLDLLNELRSNTTYAWVTDYQGSGVSGGTWTANGLTLFIPAAGLKYTIDTNVSDENTKGYIWGANAYDIYARVLVFDSTQSYINEYSKLDKLTIRGVID